MGKATQIPAYGLFGDQTSAVNVVHCEAISARAGAMNWQIVPHRHKQLYQLLVIETGKADALIDAQQRVILPGQFLFVPSQTVHSYTFLPQTDGTVISLPTALSAAFGARQGDIDPYLATPCVGTVADAFGTILDQLARACEDRSPFAQHAATGLALYVLSQIARQTRHGAQGETGTHAHHVLRAFDTAIERDLAQDHHSRKTAAQHAATLNISAGHLSRLCRAQTGKGATAYLEARIMEEACRNLAFTTLGIAQIGYRLGFSDASYFTRRFQKYSGQTPSDYRRTCFQTNATA